MVVNRTFSVLAGFLFVFSLNMSASPVQIGRSLTAVEASELRAGVEWFRCYLWKNCKGCVSHTSCAVVTPPGGVISFCQGNWFDGDRGRSGCTGDLTAKICGLWCSNIGCANNKTDCGAKKVTGCGSPPSCTIVPCTLQEASCGNNCG
jgi:hypothetical protein